MTRAVMIQGTASHAGKSVLAAALGRWLAERGRNVAPFKAQNMSLNSYVTLAGEEIARSQATQAAALGREPTADMNPILLKPLETGCQVVVQGRGVGVMTIHEYYAYKPQAWRAIVESYDRLASQHEIIVLEGAGSPAEINLKANDLVNMRMAEHADAQVLLVADIERGGVFAQLVGTWELLDAEERRRIVGFVINKFRGDASLLRSGLDYLQRRTGRPVLGVLPFDAGLQLEEEDSLGLPATEAAGELDIAVIRLPGISNFTDFAALGRAPGVAVRYVTSAAGLGHPDLLILPGTRTTVRALEWLHAGGLAERIRQFPGRIIGLCGGCQLLGRTIRDPAGVESAAREAAGLGLLDLDTEFRPGKVLKRVAGEIIAGLGRGSPVLGYEVHHGVSRRGPGVSPWLRLTAPETADDGACSADGRVCGSYVHGLFDDARCCQAIIAELRRQRGLPPLSHADWHKPAEAWDNRFHRLASWLAEHCDLSWLSETSGQWPVASGQ